LTAKYSREFPNVVVAGTLAPPFVTEFTDDQSLEMVNRINEVEPDVLWVGMSAPKQEKWIQANRTRLRACIAVPIGAVFDFYAGSIQRPGPLARALGLEWLVRLVREPRRLWRRTLISAPSFVVLLLRQHFGSRAPREG